MTKSLRFRGKKAESILIMGMIYSAFMTLVLIMTLITWNYLKFDQYAGQDAQNLTMLMNKGNDKQLYLETVGKDFFRESSTKKCFDTMAADKSIIFETGGRKFIVVERNGTQYYEKINQVFYSCLEDDFNSIVANSAFKLYTERMVADSDDNYQKEYISKNLFDMKTSYMTPLLPTKFAFYFSDDHVYGFAMTTQMSCVRSNCYYNRPHISVPFDDIFGKTMDKMKLARQKSEACLIEKKTVADCKTEVESILGSNVGVVLSKSDDGTVVLAVEHRGVRFISFFS